MCHLQVEDLIAIVRPSGACSSGTLANNIWDDGCSITPGAWVTGMMSLPANLGWTYNRNKK
jgi:hypothetical protein